MKPTTLLSGTGHRRGVCSISFPFYQYRISVNRQYALLICQEWGDTPRTINTGSSEAIVTSTGFGQLGINLPAPKLPGLNWPDWLLSALVGQGPKVDRETQYTK